MAATAKTPQMKLLSVEGEISFLYVVIIEGKTALAFRRLQQNYSDKTGANLPLPPARDEFKIAIDETSARFREAHPGAAEEARRTQKTPREQLHGHQF